MTELVAYLGNEALHDPCVRTATSLGCGFPITRLHPGGALLTWTEVGGPPGHRLEDEPGTPASIGGHDARINIPDAPTARCQPLHASREVDVAVAMDSSPSDDDLWQLTACLADPGAADAVATALSVARSLRFTHRPS